jgi:hypothetical protein
MEKELKLSESELWKFRALFAERKALLAELTLTNIKIEDISLELEGFRKVMLEKYKCDDFDLDGKIIQKEK